jgi:RNA polymerase sigma factor (sigma-70 family)
MATFHVSSLVEASDLPAGWPAQMESSLDLWRKLVQSSWYQDNLRRCARKALRRAGCPLDWLGDLQHDAMLLLARQLTHLQGGARETEVPSPAWLLTAVRGHCREALRRIQAAQCRYRPFFDGENFVDRNGKREIAIELRRAIDGLSEPERSILMELADGHSLKQIAAARGCSYKTAWRLSRRAIELARAMLAGSP